MIRKGRRVGARWSAKGAGALACSVALVLGTAGPGFAAGFKDGEIWRSDCTIQPADPWLQVRASGTVDIDGPGKSSPTQRVSSSLTTWHVAGTYNGGYWSVSATGTVSNSQTYGFCRNP